MTHFDLRIFFNWVGKNHQIDSSTVSTLKAKPRAGQLNDLLERCEGIATHEAVLMVREVVLMIC